MAEQTVSILAVLKDQLSQPLQQSAKAAGAFADQVDRSDKAAALMTAKAARLTSRLLGLQFALQGMTSGTNSFPGLNEKVQAVSGGFQTFAGIVSVMPNKLGLAIGLVAGVGQAIAGLAAPSKQAREEIEKTLKRLEEF